MTQRYTLTKDTYMPLDGQWQIVLSGTVFDAADTFGISTTSATKLSPAEAPIALASHGQPTPVRNVRTK